MPDSCWTCCHSDSELDMNDFAFEWDEVMDFDGNYMLSSPDENGAQVYVPGELLQEEEGRYGTKYRIFEEKNGHMSRITAEVYTFDNRRKPIRDDTITVRKYTWDPTIPRKPTAIEQIIYNQGKMDSLLVANQFLKNRISQVVAAKKVKM